MSYEGKRSSKGNSLIDYLTDYISIDIETTGYSPNVDEIIEIGAVKVKENKVVDTFHSYLKIKGDVPEPITKLTGITNDIIKSFGVDPAMAMRALKEFLSDEILVGYNVNFDINFLYDNFEHYLNEPLENDFVDVLRIAKQLVKGLPNYRLKTLNEKFDIENEKEHTALSDAIATHNLYTKLADYQNHYLEYRMREIGEYNHDIDFLKNTKVSIKTKFKLLDYPVIEEILKRYGSKCYSFYSKFANILIINDKEYQKIKEPLNSQDPYLLFFYDWMFKAQERVNEGTLKVLSESEFCGLLNIQQPFKYEQDIDVNNPLYGKVCVFTGTLDRFTRTQAEKIVESIGGIIGKGVTKKTSYLILGNNDYNLAIKNGKSNKQKKAEELQLQGCGIKIIPEDTFYEMIGEDL